MRALKTDSKKRKQIFLDLTKKSTDIFFLQETHSIKEIERTWRQEWEREIIFSHGTSRSKGVAILVTNKIKDCIKETIIDPDGRYIIMDIIKDNVKYTAINIICTDTKL